MNKIWLTWNYSQRSRSISNDLGIPIWEYVNENSIRERHVISTLETFFIILKQRPSIIYIQYSYLLLIIVVLYKILSFKRVVVVCDCHTKALRRTLDNWLGGVFYSFKKVSFKLADISIVSNNLMLDDIKQFTNKYFILPDKIPNLITNKKNDHKFDYCVFASAYAVDEPLAELIQATEKLNGDVFVYCTGKIPKKLGYLSQQPYRNIYFTDYLDDEEYVNLIANAKCILALTTEEGCLQCAGYEALALNVPLVVSESQALRNYFDDSVIYVKNKADDISKGIRRAVAEEKKLKSRMADIRTVREQEYNAKLKELQSVINLLSS